MKINPGLTEHRNYVCGYCGVAKRCYWHPALLVSRRVAATMQLGAHCLLRHPWRWSP